MNTKTRKRLTLVLVLCLAVTLVVGSFAFFTDRLTANTTATAGNINLVWEDTSLATGSNNEFAINKVWDNEALVSDGNIINPGDYFDLSYTLTNTGSKSIDVRQQLVLVSSEPMTDAAEEYQLTIISVDGETAIKATKVEATAEGGTKITYDLNDITINGSKEEEDGAFTFADGAAYTVRLDFAIEADNDFMDSIVSVDLYAAAKQHRNTEEGDFPAAELLAGLKSDEAVAEGYEQIADVQAPAADPEDEPQG